MEDLLVVKLKITVRLYGQLQSDYNVRELLLEFRESELSIEKLLNLINENHLPGILKKIRQGNYVLLHNGSVTKDLQENLNDGDVIAILPPAVGGYAG